MSHGEYDAEAGKFGSARHLLIGHEIHHMASTSSTMDDVAALAACGAAEGLVVIADEQTKGRGRHDREWLSAPGDDLLFSILFRPRPAIAVEINMVLALAITHVVDQVCGGKAMIKWPNDVRIDGAKIAGILLESQQNADGLVAVSGVGLNVNSQMSGKNPGGPAAISMSDITGRSLDRHEILDGLLERIDNLYSIVRTGSTLFPQWRDRIETLGKQVDVTFVAESTGNTVISGVAEDVDQSGRLLVRDSNGRMWPVAAGEVTLQAG